MQINTSQNKITIFALTKRNRKSKHEVAKYKGPLLNFEYACLVDGKLYATHAQSGLHLNSLSNLKKF